MVYFLTKYTFVLFAHLLQYSIHHSNPPNLMCSFFFKPPSLLSASSTDTGAGLPLEWEKPIKGNSWRTWLSLLSAAISCPYHLSSFRFLFSMHDILTGLIMCRSFVYFHRHYEFLHVTSLSYLENFCFWSSLSLPSFWFLNDPWILGEESKI